MSTWFKLLPFELTEVTAFMEPIEEVKPGETPVGTVSDDLKKLYTLWRNLKKEADLLAVEFEYRKFTDEERGKISELKSKARALEMIFWIGTYDELHLWSHTAFQPDIRIGWQVVEIKPPEIPFRFMQKEP